MSEPIQPARATILRLIAERPTISVRELAEEAGVSEPRVYQILNPLGYRRVGTWTKQQEVEA